MNVKVKPSRLLSACFPHRGRCPRLPTSASRRVLPSRQGFTLRPSLFTYLVFIYVYVLYARIMLSQKRSRLRCPTKQASLALEAGFVGTWSLLHFFRWFSWQRHTKSFIHRFWSLIGSASWGLRQQIQHVQQNTTLAKLNYPTEHKRTERTKDIRRLVARNVNGGWRPWVFILYRKCRKHVP